MAFPSLNPTFFKVFLSWFHKNALQLLKGSYTFWTLWLLIIITVGHTTLYFCGKCHRKCHLRTRQPAGWERDSGGIQNLLTQRKTSSDSTSAPEFPLVLTLWKERWCRGDNRPNTGLLTAGRWEEEEKQKQEARGGEDGIGNDHKCHVAAAQKFRHPGWWTVQLAKLQFTWTWVLFFLLHREPKKKVNFYPSLWSNHDIRGCITGPNLLLM